MREDAKITLSAVDQATQVFQKVGAGALTLNNQLASMADGLKGAFAGAAAGMTLVGIANGVRESIAQLAKLDDAAEKTGASVEKLSGLFKVAKISGIDTSLVEQSLVKLTKTIESAGDSGSEAAKALKVLGLAQKDLAGLDTADALKLVADRMNGFADGSGKTALAIALLGKSGAEALPYLKDLADETNIVGKATAKAAAEAEAFEKNMARLAAHLSGVSKSIAAEVLPSLVSYTDELVLATQKTGGFIQSLLLFGTVNPALQATAENIGELADRLAKLKKEKAAQDAAPFDGS